jgi:hypothetical protein
MNGAKLRFRIEQNSAKFCYSWLRINGERKFRIFFQAVIDSVSKYETRRERMDDTDLAEISPLFSPTDLTERCQFLQFQ